MGGGWEENMTVDVAVAMQERALAQIVSGNDPSIISPDIMDNDSDNETDADDFQTEALIDRSVVVDTIPDTKSYGEEISKEQDK